MRSQGSGKKKKITNINASGANYQGKWARGGCEAGNANWSIREGPAGEGPGPGPQSPCLSFPGAAAGGAGGVPGTRRVWTQPDSALTGALVPPLLPLNSLESSQCHCWVAALRGGPPPEEAPATQSLS